MNVTTPTTNFINIVGGAGCVLYSPLSLNAGVITHPEVSMIYLYIKMLGPGNNQGLFLKIST
jgi:ABC-type taurine transport system ATPase subunit